jgi:hypothetical protein
MRLRPLFVAVCVASALLGCSGSSSLKGQASVVMGGTPLGKLSSPLAAGVAPALADGTWLLSPNQAKVTLTKLNFRGATSAETVSADLTDCTPTYDLSQGSGAQLMSCPFEVPPGTYLGMDVSLKGTFEILVSDPVNGIYSDASAPSKLSTNPPAQGAQFVSHRVGMTGSADPEPVFTTVTNFPKPLELSAENPPQLYIVVDMLHALSALVTSGVPALVSEDGHLPVHLVTSATAGGHSAFYPATGTAQNVRTAGNSEDYVRILYSDPTTPALAIFLIQGCNAGVLNSAANFGPDDGPVSDNGFKTGGWLGQDSTGRISWASPADRQYSAYASYFVLEGGTDIGLARSLLCKNTSAVPPPSSGSTYASGAPAILDPTVQRSLTLVAY